MLNEEREALLERGRVKREERDAEQQARVEANEREGIRKVTETWLYRFYRDVTPLPEATIKAHEVGAFTDGWAYGTYLWRADGISWRAKFFRYSSSQMWHSKFEVRCAERKFLRTKTVWREVDSPAALYDLRGELA